MFTRSAADAAVATKRVALVISNSAYERVQLAGFEVKVAMRGAHLNG